MTFWEKFDIQTPQWHLSSAYEKFEQLIVLLLSGLIIVVIMSAVGHLAVKILFGLILSTSFDPTDPAIFQTVFGMILTVIIALEFKHSILIMAKREQTIVQVHTVILIAILAIVRKFIIIDLSSAAANQLFALAAAVIALGAVYWLVRDQDRKKALAAERRKTP